MSKFYFKQAIYLPLLYFGAVFLGGLFAIDYSHLSKHASELGINSNGAAVWIFNTGAILTGMSILLFAFGLKINFKNQFNITSILSCVFGITFIFGAVFPIGSPWHGIYGLGLCVMLLPVSFLYEQKDLIQNKYIKPVSILANLFIFIYLWLMVSRLDPINYRGLTQRLFGIVVFGWLSYISFQLYLVSKKLQKA